MKNLENLHGLKILSKNDQKAINGGIRQDQCYASISQATCVEVGGFWNPIFQKCLVTRIPDGEDYQYIGC